MQVVWSKRAEIMLHEAITYGAETFGTKAAENFFKRVNHCVDLLAENPSLGKIEHLPVKIKREYRSIVVHKKFKLVYYVGENIVYIMLLWNCLRDERSMTEVIELS